MLITMNCPLYHIMVYPILFHLIPIVPLTFHYHPINGIDPAYNEQVSV